MRALVLGSLVPQTARTVWRWLAAGHEIAELWIADNASAAWRRRERRLQWLAPTWSVLAAARRWSVPVRRVASLRQDPALEAAARRPGIDVLLASCFPERVPDELLAHFAGRACNLHPTLLPRYRGPAPLLPLLYDEALDASGVTLHLMTRRFDEGDLVAQQPVPWPANGGFRAWEADLAEACGRLAVEALPQFLAGQLAAQPQPAGGAYVRGLPREALAVDRTLDERRARWLASAVGEVAPLAIAAPWGVERVVAVTGSQSATGEPARRVGWRTVQCDVADARLAWRRCDKLHRRWQRIHELALLRRRPLAA